MMTIQESGVAPYAPPSAVLNLIDRFRNHGLAAPFTLEVLQRAGVSESLAPRTLQALKLLDLVGEDGAPTEELVDLSKARSDEYEERLAAVVRSAYADVFSFVDPAADPVERVEDAFRSYNPRSQRGRMVTLFLGLCRAAGIVDVPLRRGDSSRPSPGVRTTKPSTAGKSAQRRLGRGAPARAQVGAVPPAIAGVINQLPEPGTAWTTRQRGKFVAAFGAALDLLYDVDDTVAPVAGPEEEDDEDGS
jgi:hypothetical protein